MGLSSSIDLTEILFTLFWVFFVGLVFYLHRENKREGYPLEADHANGATLQGFPAVPRSEDLSEATRWRVAVARRKYG